MHNCKCGTEYSDNKLTLFGTDMDKQYANSANGNDYLAKLANIS